MGEYQSVGSSSPLGSKRTATYDEELGSVGVGSRVSHGQATEASVFSGLALEGLIGKRFAVDGLAASPISASKVT